MLNKEVVRGATVVHGGDVTWPPPAVAVSAAPAAAVEAPPEPMLPMEKPEPSAAGPIAAFVLGGATLLGLGAVAPAAFMGHFTVFVLACFVGYMVVWNVTPALHTPLMSVTNAISSIIILGALLQISSSEPMIM